MPAMLTTPPDSDNEEMPDHSPSSSSSSPTTPLHPAPSPPSSQPQGLAPPPLSYATHPNLQQNPGLQQQFVDPTPPGSTNTTPLNQKVMASVGGLAAGNGKEDSQAGKPAWMTKKAIEEAQAASARLLDKDFSLSWVGDVCDVSDMFN
ncbi:hypothetical protein EX30DRAFT_339164 [Ascodesmis nigricans]|uniref:Uncharacterized protein n=1 Tax=Ascodesmis nigricans TaxID=341454 RepID=A0A4V3SJ74_9PEZI|nr:hypothetical protein EX30DRAFT_339164 [Ascodesmis nigricans]